MIKKLDKLILKSFFGPFIITFFVAFFVLMMQSIWKYLDDLVGKGLDFITIGKFVWYVSATLLTLTMPIAILISSIMTFGNLGESFQLVAIKSSGISLLRFMRSLIWIALLLSGITFLFANHIIPYANLKFATLYTDIRYKNPAFDLKEGVFFTHIPNYAIKVGKKEANGQTIKNILIYEQNNAIQDNCIVAESGVMKVSADKRFLEFNLKNGHRYHESGNIRDSATEYVRIEFKEFKKLIDMSNLLLKNSSDSNFRNNFRMLSVRQLDYRIDSLKKEDKLLSKKVNAEIAAYVPYQHIKDTLWKKIPQPSTPGNYDSLIPDSAKYKVTETAIMVVNNIKNTLVISQAEAEGRRKDLRLHQMEWHRKFSLSMGCLILFFIGAPMGAIIRKGGLGMPLVVAIIFFLLFHLLNMFGEKFVKENITSPFIGTWLAVIVLGPIGMFLTYKAMHDSQLFNIEFYYRVLKKIKKLFFLKRKN